MSEKLGSTLIAPGVLVLSAAGVYAIGDAVLAPTPLAKSPGFIDTVLASHAVVAAIRLAIIFAGAFVVISVVALIAKGQWLTKVGPVEVSRRFSGLDAENQRLRESLRGVSETIDNLKRDLAQSSGVLGQILEDSEGFE